MQRVSYGTLYDALLRVLLKLGFRQDRAALCARLFAETSRDGVYSHGLNRFPRFVEMIRGGVIDVEAEPVRVGRFGALERWDGRQGPGNLNAYACMDRAVTLAQSHGLGCVALRNTNHWMRGGSYGWQAAEAGAVGLCWTNTMPNLPSWGARDCKIGNNPVILAVPRPEGHVVLDMAMSQFSYGALAGYRRRGLSLPVDGGFDEEGRLTRDAAAIEASGRPLPVGYWKGSGLAIMLDVVAALLSGGLATHQITPEPLKETALSQVFIAIHPAAFNDEEAGTQTVNGVLDFVHSATPAREGEAVYYPGERTLATRKANLENGIPVEPSIWQEVLAMGDGGL